MNKKGFTLIELLAVIVILAVIALIATPIVLNIIKDSRESAALRSAEMYLKGVETSVATATINNKKLQDGTYPITQDGDICLVELTNNTCSDDDTLKVEMNGEKPSSGSITIASGKIKDISLTYSNGKTIIKNSEDKLVYEGSEGENGSSDKVAITPKKQTYSVGELVTIGEESFYVIADDAEKVTLLARDYIDTTTLVQSPNAATVTFSSTNYWSSETEYPLDLNNYTIPEGVTTPALTAAKTYGTKVGGTGRLMTKEESDTLNTEEYSDILYGKNGKSSNSALTYWLGYANDNNFIWRVASSIVHPLPFSTSQCVRPVVEISKSKIN